MILVVALIPADFYTTWAYFTTATSKIFSVTTGTWEVIPPQSGTSITAEKSASGYWEQEGGIDSFGVRGAICVSNQGEWPTRDLTIVDTVQIKIGPGQFFDYVSQPVDLSSKPVLAPGETNCYSYKISLTPIASARYRNIARVTITNHAGWMPGDKKCPGTDICPYGPEIKADFKLPESQTLIGEGSATGKSVPEETPTPALDDEGEAGPAEGIEATATLASREEDDPTETSIPAEDPEDTETPTPTATPTPTLLPTATETPIEEPALSGCTYSAGHWALNPQDWPVDELELGGERYSSNEALEILLADPEEDEALALLQQLVAAELNLENGAEGDAGLDELVQAADEWLEAHPPGSNLKKVHREEAAELAAVLEDFNKGVSGPGQCKDEGSRPLPTHAPETAEPSPTLVPTSTTTVEAAPSETPTPSPTLPVTTNTPTGMPSPTGAEATSTLAPSETPEPTPTQAEEDPTETPLPTDTPTSEP